VTHLLFVEDDQLLPVGVLAAVLDAARDHPIVTVDYQTRSGELMVGRHPKTGEVLLTPMGFLLVRRDVFDRIPSPPWQVGTQWELRRGVWHDTGRVARAGGQDAHFSRQVVAAGITIHALPGWEVGHLDRVQQGGRTNDGMDVVRCYGGTGDLQWAPPPIWTDNGQARALRRAAILAADADAAPPTSDMEAITVADEAKDSKTAAAPAGPANIDTSKAPVASAATVPPRRDEHTAYLMSEKGTVLDMQRGKPLKNFLKHAKGTWIEITKAQFDKALVAQTEHRQQRIAEQKRELAEMDA